MQLKTKVKIGITLTSLIVILFSVYLIYTIISTLIYIKGKPEDIIYESNVQDKTDYNIFLKPNDFMVNVDNTESYITSLVDFVRINFDYLYIRNNKVNINYRYDVKANVISEYINETLSNVSKPIWNKEFILLNTVSESSKNSTFTIKRIIDIDTKYYNQLIDTFRNTLNIPTNSRLEVKLTIYVNGQLLNNQKIQKEYYILLTIPLGARVFDISLYKNFEGQEIIYNKDGKSSESNYAHVIIYIILLGLNIYVGIRTIRGFNNKGKNRSTLLLKRLLKDYDERIVTVTSFVKYKHLDIVDIKEFDELLDLSEETLEPIIYWEKSESEHWFAIIRNKILYKYIIYTINKKP
jgi:hypothetical protein